MHPDIQNISNLKDITSNFKLIFSDIWGVIHNGNQPFQQMRDYLTQFRKDGGAVILISNAPRQSPFVKVQLDMIGVSSDAYDAIVTSGDLTAAEIAPLADKKPFYIGIKTETSLYKQLQLNDTTLEEADYILCTSFFNDHDETLEDYQDILNLALKRKLRFYCANPDLVVDHGGKMLLCAGTIATAYEEMGGDVFWAGKPYTPIYDWAHKKAEKITNKTIKKSEILAIGDAIRTDIAGAEAFGVESVMVTTGIHATVFQRKNNEEQSKWFQEQICNPNYLLEVSA